MSANALATILLVDDQPANRAFLVEQLFGHGFHLSITENSEMAVKWARTRRPDLLLLDVKMPAMDGFETCRRFKADAALAGIPVIFLTTLTDAEEKAVGYDAGGVDFISKPIDIADLLLRMRTHLTLSRLQIELAQHNGQLEQRVTERTNELEEEVVRRMQSENEKSVLLEVVRRQSRQLQTLTNQVIEMQLRQRELLMLELDQRLSQNLAHINDHLNEVTEQVTDINVQAHLDNMAQWLEQTIDFVNQMGGTLKQSPEEAIEQANPLLALSDRERKVFLLIVNNHSTDTIAKKLHISPSTVRTYRYRILQKLGVQDQDALIRFAMLYSLS